MGTARHNATAKKRWPRWARGFLATLGESGNVRLSCLAAQIERSTAYRLRESNPSFASAWDEALDLAADIMEQEAFRRAVEGTEKPVFGSMGFRMGSGEIGRVREYSDTLLIFLLKGARPEKYRERTEIRSDQTHHFPDFEQALEKAYAGDTPTTEPA